jgi:hypothetical protein
MDAFYKKWFPKLSDVAGKKTSECNHLYNCIAWAFKDSQKHWWPNTKRSFWPVDATGLSAIEAFEAWFRHDGWEETTDKLYDKNFDKVALFTLNGSPTHAARLIANDIWTSKLGPNIDLSHSFDDLDGPAYGAVYKIYKKATS